MTCNDVRGSFSALADGMAAADEAAACRAHLATCDDCRRDWEAFQSMLGLLHRVEPVHAPAGFVDRVVAAARPIGPLRRLGRALFVPLRVKLPAEALGIAIVAVIAVVLFERTPGLKQGPLVEDQVIATAPAPRPAPSVEPDTTRLYRAPSPAPDAPRARPTAPAPETPQSRNETVEKAVVPRAPDAARDAADRETMATEQSSSPSRGEAKPGEQSAAAPAAPQADAPRPEPKRFGEQVRGRVALRSIGTPVSGTLLVKDRAHAERTLAELVARVGASEASKHAVGTAVVVEIALVEDTYTAFVEGLTAIGVWKPDRVPVQVAAPMRVVVRISGD